MERKPDFPLPWLVGRLPVPKYARGRRVIYTPHLAGYQWVGSSTYPLDIEWQGATIDEIVDDFRDWVRVQAKHHPEMKGRGRAGQLQIAPLTWLAAYRIHKAGVTFEDAWFRLEAEPNHYGHLPIYSEKSGWSDAIKNATGLLSQIESGL